MINENDESAPQEAQSNKPEGFQPTRILQVVITLEIDDHIGHSHASIGASEQRVSSVLSASGPPPAVALGVNQVCEILAMALHDSTKQLSNMFAQLVGQSRALAQKARGQGGRN